MAGFIEPDNTTELERVLAAARDSDSADRLPRYRDAVAAFGAAAIEPLVAWIGTPALAGFAIRTIERIATLDPEAAGQAIVALAWLERDGLDDATRSDLDASLVGMGVNLKRASRGRTAFDVETRAIRRAESAAATSD